MKVSVCLTVFNEEGSIVKLLDSLLIQSKKPDEIVIVDGGSTDKTVDILRHYQKKDQRIKLLVEKCSRSCGRNIAVETSKNDSIAMTDAGCVAKRFWLRRLTEPLTNKDIDISAGFYTMTGDLALQKAFAVFLGTSPHDFNVDFLPSTRSIAFKREAWEKLGGFPEKLEDTAEDTVFNYKALREGLNFTRVKNARVEWEMPNNFGEGISKIYNYAKGDAKTKIFNFPTKGLTSHNIKALLIFCRYLIGLVLLVYSFFHPTTYILLLIAILLYVFRSFRKVYLKTGSFLAGLWGIALQLSSDIAVMAGFIAGFIR
jgi:glycosyltransferase involved in cell wall biosynthesis